MTKLNLNLVTPDACHGWCGCKLCGITHPDPDVPIFIGGRPYQPHQCTNRLDRAHWATRLLAALVLAPREAA